MLQSLYKHFKALFNKKVNLAAKSSLEWNYLNFDNFNRFNKIDSNPHKLISKKFQNSLFISYFKSIHWKLKAYFSQIKVKIEAWNIFDFFLDKQTISVGFGHFLLSKVRSFLPSNLFLLGKFHFFGISPLEAWIISNVLSFSSITSYFHSYGTGFWFILRKFYTEKSESLYEVSPVF